MREMKETPPIRRPPKMDMNHQVSTCSQTDELYSRTSPLPCPDSKESTKLQMQPKLDGSISPGFTASLSPRTHIAMMLI